MSLLTLGSNQLHAIYEAEVLGDRAESCTHVKESGKGFALGKGSLVLNSGYIIY